MEKCPGSKTSLKAASLSQSAPDSQTQREWEFPDAVFRASCLGLGGNCRPWLPAPRTTSRGPSDGVIVLLMEVNFT